MTTISSFRHLSDERLVEEVGRLATSERQATTALIASLAEFDRRRMHLALGYASVFDYCRKVLCLSEHEALNRIEAARAVRRHPNLLTRLESGTVSLTAVRLLAPHLTAANYDTLITDAEGKSTEGVRLLIAKMNPQPPVPSILRKLPQPKAAVASSHEGSLPTPGETAAVPTHGPIVSAVAPETLSSATAQVASTHAPATRRPVITPLSESHYKLQVTISAAARERLSQIQGLMRHRLSSGDPAAIVEHALEVLHAELLKQKAAQVARPRAGREAREAKGRYIPASVKREVWRRDQGRCAFVALDGTRCGSAHGVEFHHVQPYAVGGETTASNIEIRCRAHNGFEWQQHLEGETMSLVAQAT